MAWIIKASILIQRIDGGHVVAREGEGKAREIFPHSLGINTLNDGVGSSLTRPPQRHLSGRLVVLNCDGPDHFIFQQHLL